MTKARPSRSVEVRMSASAADGRSGAPRPSPGVRSEASAAAASGRSGATGALA